MKHWIILILPYVLWVGTLNTVFYPYVLLMYYIAQDGKISTFYDHKYRWLLGRTNRKYQRVVIFFLNMSLILCNHLLECILESSTSNFRVLKNIFLGKSDLTAFIKRNVLQPATNLLAMHLRTIIHIWNATQHPIQKQQKAAWNTTS